MVGEFYRTPINPSPPTRFGGKARELRGAWQGKVQTPGVVFADRHRFHSLCLEGLKVGVD